MATLDLLKKVQFALTPNTLMDVFTGAPGRRTTITVYICNRAGAATTFRLSLAINGESDDPKQYIYYNANLPINNVLKEGFTLNEGDVVRLYSPGTVSVSIFPDESEQLYG